MCRLVLSYTALPSRVHDNAGCMYLGRNGSSGTKYDIRPIPGAAERVTGQVDGPNGVRVVQLYELLCAS